MKYLSQEYIDQTDAHYKEEQLDTSDERRDRQTRQRQTTKIMTLSEICDTLDESNGKMVSLGKYSLPQLQYRGPFLEYVQLEKQMREKYPNPFLDPYLFVFYIYKSATGHNRSIEPCLIHKDDVP